MSAFSVVCISQHFLTFIKTSCCVPNRGQVAPQVISCRSGGGCVLRGCTMHQGWTFITKVSVGGGGGPFCELAPWSKCTWI